MEPPAELELRLETTLGSLVELAADELEAWELSLDARPAQLAARRARPAAAVVVGSGAAAGLVVLRTRGKRHRRRAQARNALDLAERTLRDSGARGAARVPTTRRGDSRRVIRSGRMAKYRAMGTISAHWPTRT